MHSPYTSQPLDAFTIAQTSVAVALTAITWSRPARFRPSSWILVAAVWWAALLPVQDQLLEAFGRNPSPDDYHDCLNAQAALGTISVLLSGRSIALAFAILSQIALAKVGGFVQTSEWELAGLNLAYLGVLVGLQARARDEDIMRTTDDAEGRSFLTHDVRWFALATLLAIATCFVILKQSIDSSDEWAYTFQAAVFAKGRAFAPAPPCSPAFQNFWVFEEMGRQFSQYTPGWPLFMTPFSLLGVPQFAAAFSLGLLVVGVARLARRASRDSGQIPRAVAAAGTIGALCTTFASTLLINGGSRFGHVFAAALLAWSMEAFCAVEDACRAGDARRQVGWSIALGTCASLLCATRPGEGAVSAVGLALYGVYALVRRRLTGRAVLATAAAGAFFGGFTLVILRLQLGAWFKTGYSLTPAWSKFALSWPEAGDWKYGFPLATGAYCWWPLSPAVGAAGLVALRRSGQRIAFMLGIGTIALFVFVSTIVLGRGFDWAYGPRYVLTAVVAMGVGTGVALAPLWARARFARPGTFAAGPATLAAAAVVVGVLRLAPLVYPPNTASVRTLNALNEEIRREQLHHAVVLLPVGTGWKNEGLDLTMNLPLTLYRKQDVLIAMDKSPALSQCVRDEFPDRTFYTALPGPPVHIKKD